MDVECQVDGGGYSGQAGALRWGIATSLRSFVDPEMVEKMRIGMSFAMFINIYLKKMLIIISFSRITYERLKEKRKKTARTKRS